MQLPPHIQALSSYGEWVHNKHADSYVIQNYKGLWLEVASVASRSGDCFGMEVHGNKYTAAITKMIPVESVASELRKLIHVVRHLERT